MSAETCSVGCGHPPDDHEDGRCMHLCDCAWPTAESDATCEHTGQRVDVCLCMIHDPDGAHFRATCPGMQTSPIPPDLTTELADRLVDRANELLDEGSSDAAE